MKEEKFVKYPRIAHLDESLDILDNPVQVFEKMDGGNSQIRKMKGRVRCGTRAHYLDDKNFNKLWFPTFYAMTMKNHSWYNLPEDMIVFAEWLAPHTLDYTADARNKAFVLDVYDTNENRFMPYEEGRKRLEDSGIEDIQFLTPIISGKTNLRELEEQVLERDSDYRDNKKKMEGVVVKDYDNQKFAKLWRRTVLGKVGKISLDDLRRAMFNMVEEGQKETTKNLIKKMKTLFKEEGRRIDERRILDAIERYEKRYKNLKI
jgi:ATP-dependent RNA circularization protein (DNA/RNA ligase family)